MLTVGTIFYTSWHASEEETQLYLSKHPSQEMKKHIYHTTNRLITFSLPLFIKIIQFKTYFIFLVSTQTDRKYHNNCKYHKRHDHDIISILSRNFDSKDNVSYQANSNVVTREVAPVYMQAIALRETIIFETLRLSPANCFIEKPKTRTQTK